MMKNKMFKRIAATLALALAGCASSGGGASNSTPVPRNIPVTNGGFEMGNLTGWTVEWGDAFDDDCVTSRTTFSFPNDNQHQEIGYNHTGNWYLNGKGFDLSRRNARTGSLRSSNFHLDEDGIISFKLAGGAIAKGKGAGAELKPAEKRCYLGVYRASDDMLVHYQENEYFVEHTEDYVNASQYELGVYHTDNFSEYSVDLSEYKNDELYLRIVDNDQDVYYGYISVDDIRIGEFADPQEEGAFYTKTKTYIEDCDAPSEYEIKNGGFETGSLAGWDVLSGEAFSNEGVNAESTWWNENITYSREGDYHYGHYSPTATGVMRSSEFVLGGCGYVSFKLGGCANQDLTYLSFKIKEGDAYTEIAKASNYKYWNFQFPYVANGMRLLNMVQYRLDLSSYIGQTMVIDVIDNNTSSDELGCIVLDSVQTYHVSIPEWYDSEFYDCVNASEKEIIPESDYQAENGSFETGDLTGWETSWTNEEDRIGVVTSDTSWWDGAFPYNAKGAYLFSGIADEGKTGYLKSSSFRVGGLGKITFLMGGGHNPTKVYISIHDSETDEELYRYSNHMFHDLGAILVNRGENLANMVSYVADISGAMDKDVYIKVVDNATNDWGLVTVDSFITYYTNESAIPSGAFEAIDILHVKNPEPSDYQIVNGGFETGDLSGWTEEGEAIGNTNSFYMWWNEGYLFNKTGNYFFSGWGADEGNKGRLISSAFTVSGANIITFKLGGGGSRELTNVQILDADTDEVLMAFGNHLFHDMASPYYYTGRPIDLSADGVYLANMALYKADLSALTGQRVKIALNDQATANWGLLFADDFITYYAQESDVPANAVAAIAL